MEKIARPRKRYKRLRFEDRKQIEKLYNGNNTVEEMAAIIGVNSSTVYRELLRGGNPYCAETAQKAIGESGRTKR